MTKRSSGLTLLKTGQGWAAFEKPCGMSVHNRPGEDLVSLVTQMAETDPQALGLSETPESVHAVHRLDAETSGIVLIAFGKEAARALTRQFEEKRVQKIYGALLHGLLDADSGIWNAPLAKEAGGRSNIAGAGKKQPCDTRFEVVERTNRYTLVKLAPGTGRKHQLRRHAALAGHPIIGDRRYSSKKAISVLKERFHYERLSLHAFSLTFTPPGETASVTVTTDPVPGEVARLMQRDSASS